MSVYFTSDTHFHHTNIVQYCNRPFADVEAMNAGMVAQWNARVQPSDTVYHLGDFAMGKADLLDGTRALLNGRVILVLGNHDRTPSRMRQAGFDEVHKSLTVQMDGLTLFMRHIPPHPSEVIPYCDYFLCGHVHDAWVRQGKVINVGVDAGGWNGPRTLSEILGQDL